MGKEKLATYFRQIKEKHDHLFVPYIVAGDGEGGVNNLPERINFLQESGAAAIELGIPFSDPVADGPTVQAGGLRALENGTTLHKVLNVLEPKKATRDIPIVLMTYMNPIFAFGIEEFAATCARVGVDGIIIPDVPMEEEDLIATTLKRYSIAFIRLAALTSTPERLKEIAKRSEGFLYAVSVTGTTGTRASHEDRVGAYLEDLKQMCDIPVLAGFGVSNANQAHALSKHCDGVIVGSKIVDLFHQGKENEVRHLIRSSISNKTSLA